MIPRYQRILFLALMTLSVLMAGYLWRVHQRTIARLNSISSAATPIEAPGGATIQTEAVTFLLADDAAGTITPSDRQIALPNEPTIRLRAILERLFSDYGQTDSRHPLKFDGSAIADVFFLPLPLTPPKPPESGYKNTEEKTTPSPTAFTDMAARNGYMAVINLRQSFADAHPSGIEVETLTVLSILGTVHANFPQVSRIRFLVDGKTRPTLAGHFSLDRVYPSTDTTLQSTKEIP
ncbi:GerMN domain-containing protein [Terriglobus albidus]|uniref:GerMN domain-containing protein n=1 Tax=Terriglobus albidus TaxID=1592106 RepID=UPI0021DF5EF3|nr:GerMN domain-containing protein [Terriglobus albidus]